MLTWSSREETEAAALDAVRESHFQGEFWSQWPMLVTFMDLKLVKGERAELSLFLVTEWWLNGKLDCTEVVIKTTLFQAMCAEI